MSRHYSSSKLVTWLRKKVFKVKKPTALPFGQWSIWDTELKASRPWAYFFTETLPDALEFIPKVLIDPIMNLRYFLYCKYGIETHKLHSTLKPGTWHDIDSLMMNACFTALVDYVEIELPARNIDFSNKEDIKKYNVPFWARHRLLKFKPFRCKQAGLDHLKWASQLDTPTIGTTTQNDSAIEITILYFWWTKIWGRETAWASTGLDKFWEEMSAKYGENWLLESHRSPTQGKSTISPTITSAELNEYYRLTNEVDQIEEECRVNGDEMLIRLIKVRRDLWT